MVAQQTLVVPGNFHLFPGATFINVVGKCFVYGVGVHLPGCFGFHHFLFHLFDHCSNGRMRLLFNLLPIVFAQF